MVFYYWGVGSAAQLFVVLLTAERLCRVVVANVGSWIRYSTRFSLLRSIVACLCRVRSYCDSPVTVDALYSL